MRSCPLPTGRGVLYVGTEQDGFLRLRGLPPNRKQYKLKTSTAMQYKLKQKNETLTNQYKWKNSTTMFGTRGATSCSTFQLHQLSQALSVRQGLLRGREDNIMSSFTSGLLATTHNGQRHRRRTPAVTVVQFRSHSTCFLYLSIYCRHHSNTR